MEDGDFEVTAEMLIHEDVDDESTMEEEEAFQSQKENEEELTDLQEESEIPLEVLLSRYGYNFPAAKEEEEKGKEDKALTNSTSSTSTSTNVTKQTTRLKQISHTSTITSNTTSTTNTGTSTSTANPSTAAATTTSATVTSSTSTSTTSSSKPTTNALSHTLTSSNTTGKSSSSDLPDHLKRHNYSHSHINHQINRADDTSKTGQASSISSSTSLLLASPHHPTPVSGPSRLPPPLIQVMPESEEYLVGGHQLETSVPPSLEEQGGTSSSALMEDVMLSSSSSGRGVLGKHGRSHGEEEEVVDVDHDDDTVYSDVMLACGESPISSETDEPSYRPSSSSKAAMANNDKSDPISSRLRSELPERRSIRLMNSSDRLMMENYLYLASLLEEDEEGDSDEEYVPREEWRQVKEVKVGQPHQAIVSDCPSYIPYPTDCPPNIGELIWNPQGTSNGEVSKYLESISEVVTGSQNNGERDNEQALQVLQDCNYNAKKAAEKIRKDGVSQGMLPWTEEECRNFEEGLQAVGKDFFTIKKKVPSRTVKEIIEFYYLWKKSERYDVFITQYGKIGKKKLICPPGHISDFMEKYFDLYDNDAVDLHYGTTTVYAEVKKDNS